MKLKIFTALSAAVLMGLSVTAVAQGIVDTVVTGCKTEIDTYCSQVSPGEGRMLACFYAHEDKLSGQCQYALYTASAKLDQAVSALAYVANECESDLTQYCADVAIGEGRVLSCLNEHAESLQPGCTTALNEVFKE